MQSQHFDAVIISPHIDDAVFSCGGLMALRAQDQKRILVVNIFSEHFSQSGVQAQSTNFFKVADNRHNEDKKAQGVLNFEIHNVNFKDAIFRKPKYQHARHLFSGRPDEDVVFAVREKLRDFFTTITANELYFPLGVGGHVDHMTCFHACLGQWSDRFKFRAAYEDIPYAYLQPLVALRKGQLQLGQIGQLTRDFFWSAMMSALRHSKFKWFYYLRAKSFFFYRWLNQNADAETFLPTLRSHEVDISSVIERKLKASWCYDSQTPQFLRSTDEHREFSRQYASLSLEQAGQHVERYWQEF